MKKHDESQDPYLEDVIEEAIGPLAALLPPEELEALKRSLRDATTDDPVLSALHDAARPRLARTRSGDEQKGPQTGESDQAASGAPVRKKGSAA